jgi:hypothetical protein
LRLERAAEQVVLKRQANLNPRSSPRHGTASSHEGNPASPAQPQRRAEREDAMAGLRRTAAMNSTLPRSR